MMDISLNSLLPVMTADNKERNQLSLIKGVAQVFGGMVVSIAGPIIVASGTLDSYYVLIFGFMAFALVASILGALGIKENISFTGVAEETYKFKDMLGFLTIKPVLVSFIASLAYCICSFVGTGANAYYFTYVMGDMNLMAAVSGVGIMGMIPGLIVGPTLANKLGKKKVFVAGLVLCAIGPAIRLVAPASIALAYVGTIIMNVGGGFITPLMYGIQADNTLYVQYTTGKRTEAAIASLASFVTKFGQGVAGAIPGYVLAIFGFMEGSAAQPASVDTGIILCVLVLPVIFGLTGALIFGFGYKLTKEDVDKMALVVKNKEV